MECRWTKYYAEPRAAQMRYLLSLLSILELAKGFEPLTL